MTFRNLYIQWLCKTGRAVDIWSNGGYPGEALSNLCSNAFVYDGVHCNSMEGFLQSLKYDDRQKQLQICQIYLYFFDQATYWTFCKFSYS